MANINQISLKVCGNPDANSGFQTMAIFNSPSIEIKDNFYTGFDANSYFFTIKIEKNQVVYKLVKNNVSSLGASRQGSLVIGIAIPKGYKLDKCISPYDVLIELKNRFLALCMTCKDPATEKYEFNTIRVQPNILNDVAGSYSLVPVQMPYRAMSVGAPIGYLTATEEQIKLLLNDVQYPAFTKFGEIVVAASVQGTNYTPIPNIAIPRKPEYSIYYDGVLQPEVVSDPKKLLTVNGTGDTRFFENDSLMFTLEELLNGESVPNVSIDIANEIINVSYKALIKPITRKINVVFVPKEAETYFFTRRNEWGLFYGNQQIRLAKDLSFVLTGEEVKILYNIQNFRIQQSRKDQYEARVSSVSSNEISISAVKVRRPVDPTGGTGKTGGGIVQTPSINAYEVLLTLDQAYKRSRCSVQFFNSEGVLLQSTTALFARGNDGNHIARVYVPKSWSGCNVQVRLKYKNEYWNSNNYLGRDINGVIELRDKDFSRKSIGFFSKHSRGIVISLLMLLNLLLGAAIGTFVAKNYLGTSDEQKDSVRCNICNMEFDSQDELNNHNSSIHPGGGDVSGGEAKVDSINNIKVECDNCGKEFPNYSELEAHKETCSQKVRCNECDEMFDSNSKLAAHKASVHPVVSFDCETCRKTFTTRAKLNQHIKDAHSPQICNLCNQKLADKNALTQHKRKKHHFECSECGPGVWFETEAKLNAHKAIKHVKDNDRNHRER